MQKIIKVMIAWLTINIWQIIKLVGMALIAIAAFYFNLVTGLIVTGILLIIVSIMAERG